jgi:hypothetical protein
MLPFFLSAVSHFKRRLFLLKYSERLAGRVQGARYVEHVSPVAAVEDDCNERARW